MVSVIEATKPVLPGVAQALSLFTFGQFRAAWRKVWCLPSPEIICGEVTFQKVEKLSL